MLFLSLWHNADQKWGWLRGDWEHKGQGPQVQAVPREVFSCNVSSLEFTLLRFSKVAKVAKAKGVNINQTSGPPGDSRALTWSLHPELPPPLRPWLWRGSCPQTRLSLCVTSLCQLVVRPWIPNVTNYRSPHPVAEGICVWESILWMLLELGLETIGLAGTSGRESSWSWHLPRGALFSLPASIYNCLFQTKVTKTINHQEEASGPPTTYHFFKSTGHHSFQGKQGQKRKWLSRNKKQNWEVAWKLLPN